MRNKQSASFTILVTGGRDYDYPFMVFKVLHELHVEHGYITVVHGDCETGADAYAKQWAQRNIITQMKRGEATLCHEAYPAAWDWFGKQAGPIRNAYMVNLGADLCVAFPTAASRGTISCMNLAQAAGIPVLNWGVEVPGYPSLVPM